MSKQTLIQHMSTRGKQENSWEDLARIHGMKNGEAARSAWKAYRFETPGYQKVILTVEDLAKHTCPLEPQDNGLRADDAIGQANYIAELEEKIVNLSNQMKQLPKNGVGGFNIGFNPLDFSFELQKERILQEIRNASLRTRTLRRHEPNDSNLLLELSIFDLHIGKLAWDKETGEDYDINIAVERYKAAITELTSRVDPKSIGRILLPIGNDMINVDSKANMTTAGTPQSCDSRFGKMFRAAKELIIDTISELTAIAPVDVMVIPGNHDEVTMFTLGEVLDAWFHNHEDVDVYNDPKLRKYYKYGQNMILFTHGDKERHQDLAMIAAHEEPQMWAETKFREAHLGHLHKSKVLNYINVDEHPGFKIRILPSLSGTDSWHASKGYMSAKAAEAFVWHPEKGLISNHYHNL